MVNKLVRAKVYYTKGCPRCRLTLRALEEQHIAYSKQLVLDDDPLLEDFRRAGYRSFPVVKVFRNDTLIDTMTGFQPQKIKQL